MITPRDLGTGILVLSALLGGCAHRSTTAREGAADTPSREAALSEAERLEMQAAGLRQAANSKFEIADYLRVQRQHQQAQALETEGMRMLNEARDLERRAAELRRRAAVPDSS